MKSIKNCINFQINIKFYWQKSPGKNVKRQTPRPLLLTQIFSFWRHCCFFRACWIHRKWGWMGINCDHLDEGKLIFIHPAFPAFCMILQNTSCSYILTHQSNVGNHSHSRKNVIFSGRCCFYRSSGGHFHPKFHMK